MRSFLKSSLAAKAILMCFLFLLGVSHSTASDEPIKWAPIFNEGTLTQEWETILAPFKTGMFIEAQLEELRRFPLRKYPKRLKGQLRIIRGQAASIAYTEPSSQIVLIRADHIYIKKPNAFFEKIPERAASATFLETLVPLLEMDFETLPTLFTISGKADGAQWQLELTPINDSLLKKLKKAELLGNAQALHTIVFTLGSRKSIEIRLTDLTKRDGAFDPSWEPYFLEK